MNLLVETLVWLCLSFYGLVLLGGLILGFTWAMWTFNGPISMQGDTYDRIIWFGKFLVVAGFVVGFLLQTMLILGTS